MSELQPRMGTLLFICQVAMYLHQPHLDIHQSGCLQYPHIHGMTQMFLHLKHCQGMHPSMGSPTLRPTNLPQYFILAKISMPIQSTNLPQGHLLSPRMVTSNHLDLRDDPLTSPLGLPAHLEAG